MNTLKLEEFLPFRLVRVAEAVSVEFSQIYKQKYDLSRTEWRVLANLAHLGKATATKIGFHSAMHKTKVSRAVFELEKRKWLARKIDQSDRRMEWLELTKLGLSRFENLSVLARDYETKLLNALGKDSANKLVHSLDKLEQLHNLSFKR
jgi:DNA-binding MarR family transcriptional regulator